MPTPSGTRSPSVRCPDSGERVCRACPPRLRPALPSCPQQSHLWPRHFVVDSRYSATLTAAVWGKRSHEWKLRLSRGVAVWSARPRSRQARAAGLPWGVTGSGVTVLPAAFPLGSSLNPHSKRVKFGALRGASGSNSCLVGPDPIKWGGGLSSVWACPARPHALGLVQGWQWELSLRGVCWGSRPAGSREEGCPRRK